MRYVPARMDGCLVLAIVGAALLFASIPACTAKAEQPIAPQIILTQVACMEAEKVTKTLREKYGEEYRWTGDATNKTNGKKKQFVVSQSLDGNWSIFYHDGPLICVVAGGDAGAFIDGSPL